MSAAPSDAAPSDAAAAAPAPGEKQAARLPGLRGHHKLYLAAVALVAVCVWLIVWLVVFGKVLPDDIVGLAAVVFQVTVKTGVFALLFARYVAGAGAVVAPADPEGKVGAAPSPPAKNPDKELLEQLRSTLHQQKLGLEEISAKVEGIAARVLKT